MPIKQLQLRGISRTPSDRGTVDGGCAESLNVHLDQKETAPTLPPDDISESVYGDNPRHKIVFIHKMPGVINYIGQFVSGTTSGLYAYGDHVTTHAVSSDIEGEIKHITSIGNMLIVYAESSPYYFLFKDGAYQLKGKQVPIPAIEVVSVPRSGQHSGATFLQVPFNGYNEQGQEAEFSYLDWNRAKADTDVNHSTLLGIMNSTWNNISISANNLRDDGIFYAPVFLRYAVRLYDGSYVNHSVPIMCGGGTSTDWITMQRTATRVHVGEGSRQYDGYLLNYSLNNVYNIRVKMVEDPDFESWSDLVDSIDVFVSPQITVPAFEAGFESMDDSLNVHLAGMMDGQKEKSVEDAVLSKGNFYLVKSFSLADQKEMDELKGGECVIKNMDEDLLVQQEELVDGYRTSGQYIPLSESRNFNQRVLMSGALEIMPTGLPFLNGLQTDVNPAARGNVQQYVFVYNIVDNSGITHRVISRGKYSTLDVYSTEPGYMSGHYQDLSYVTIQHFSAETTADSQLYEAKPYAWLSYPDTRCKSVDVFICEGGVVTYSKNIAMKEHPLLSCSYAFFGFGTELKDVLDADAGTEPFEPGTESRVIESANKVFLSDFQNPFLFPAGNIITFPDAVVGVGITSVPLSEGQVGDFDVYVFTEGGIRVLKTNSQGTFSTNNAYPTNLSRHVALPGTITSLEQAIVFITERGVMMLVGGDVSELSVSMNGKPYALDDSIVSVLSGTEWGELMSASENGETLMGFMRTAKVAYDNNGSRLVFFNPEKGYQYTYMLQTQSWHKILSGVTAPTILNSYPDCLVSYGTDEKKVMNFSTILDDIELVSDSENKVKGLIVTRPFDLGEPDIRKAITTVRIRGRFYRSDVRYLLLGSFDGIHWERLHSLRGGSYKQFRMAILCDLAPTERITWIDVEYEGRFTNKLR